MDESERPRATTTREDTNGRVRLKVEVRAARPKASQPRVTEEQICDTLARCQRNGNAASPNEREVSELTHWINIYRAKPWTADGVARYRDAYRDHRARRVTLDKAREILEQELREWRAYFSALDFADASAAPYMELGRKSIADWMTAISVLREHRGMDSLPPIPATGPDPQGYAIAAQKLASETLLALQAAQKRIGRPVQRTAGGKDGPLVKAVGIWLNLIYGPKCRPSRSTLFEIVQKTIGPDKR